MPYLDNFNVAGSTLKIRDLEAREIISQFVGSISGSVGNSNKPIFLANGNFKECSDVLNVNITGNATTAGEATHASSADSANEATHASSANSATTANTANSATEANHALTANSAATANTANSATKLSTSGGNNKHPIYFLDGKPTICDDTLQVNITGDSNHSNSSGTINEITNSDIHVFTLQNGRIKTMDGFVNTKTYNINTSYGGLFYTEFRINLPNFFSGLLCVNVTPQGPHGCYASVTSFNGSIINGYIICPVSTSVDLALFFHVVGY